MYNLKNRNNLRLKNYNYQKNGYYFITIVTKNREKILSKVKNNHELQISEIGLIIEESIKYMNSENVKIDKYIIMPNHIHIIIKLENSNKSLIKLISNFKRYTSNKIKKNYKIDVWQKSYFDRIIRSEKEYIAMNKYIDENPIKWNLDKYNQ